MYLLIKISKKELHKIYFDNANNDDIDMKYYTVWLKYSKTLFRHEGNPGSKEKLGQRRSYIASVVGMTLATNVGSTFIL